MFAVAWGLSVNRARMFALLECNHRGESKGKFLRMSKKKKKKKKESLCISNVVHVPFVLTTNLSQLLQRSENLVEYMATESGSRE